MKELRKFGIGLAVILAAIAGLQLWREHSTAAAVLGAAGTVSLLSAILFPGVLGPVHLVFGKIGKALGWLNTRLILALIYYAVFTPAALVMKIVRRDILARNFDPSADSYWVKKKKDNRGPERYEKMF